MPDPARLVAEAFAALDAKLCRDGLPTYSNASMVQAHAFLRLHEERVETLLAYWLDKDRRLLAVEEIGRGAENDLLFSREHLARRAVAICAENAVLVHNHPSGDPKPSDQDQQAAERVDRQLAAIGVIVLGHYVVARNGIGDVRKGTVSRFRDLVDAPGEPAATVQRCPHCLGALTSGAA